MFLEPHSHFMIGSIITATAQDHSVWWKQGRGTYQYGRPLNMALNCAGSLLWGCFSVRLLEKVCCCVTIWEKSQPSCVIVELPFPEGSSVKRPSGRFGRGLRNYAIHASNMDADRMICVRFYKPLTAVGGVGGMVWLDDQEMGNGTSVRISVSTFTSRETWSITSAL